jgi:hypothetical protein
MKFLKRNILFLRGIAEREIAVRENLLPPKPVETTL